MASYTVHFDGVPKFYEDVKRAANYGLTAAAVTGAKKMRDIFGKGRFESSPPGEPPHVQRGGLRDSIIHTNSKDLRSSCGSNKVYAKIQETGGTIKASNAKFLRVPVNVEAKRLAEKLGDKSLKTAGTKVVLLINKGKGTKYVAKITKRKKQLPVFALVPSVRLPARPWAKPAVFGNIKEILGVAQKAAASELFAAGRGRGS